MGVERAELLLLMKKAYRQKQSGTSLYWDLRAKGRVIRKSDFFSDWRGVTQTEAKAGLMRYVRRGYYPTEKTIAAVPWEKLTSEYMYKVKVKSRLEPGKPMAERFVNIMSDVPMTGRMVEQAVVEKWKDWEDYTAEAIEEIIPWTVYRQVL